MWATRIAAKAVKCQLRPARLAGGRPSGGQRLRLAASMCATCSRPVRQCCQTRPFAEACAGCACTWLRKRLGWALVAWQACMCRGDSTHTDLLREMMHPAPLCATLKHPSCGCNHPGRMSAAWQASASTGRLLVQDGVQAVAVHVGDSGDPAEAWVSSTAAGRPTCLHRKASRLSQKPGLKTPGSGGLPDARACAWNASEPARPSACMAACSSTGPCSAGPACIACAVGRTCCGRAACHTRPSQGASRGPSHGGSLHCKAGVRHCPGAGKLLLPGKAGACAQQRGRQRIWAAPPAAGP